MTSPATRSPQLIHPALWRGTQLAHGRHAVVETGHELLAAELPDGGWPTCTLIELLLPRPGIGELHLLLPALVGLAAARPPEGGALPRGGGAQRQEGPHAGARPPEGGVLPRGGGAQRQEGPHAAARPPEGGALPHPAAWPLPVSAGPAAGSESSHGGPIVLVQPPHVPHIAAWTSWGLDPARLLWVNPERPLDALWSAEQILKHACCAALLLWLPQARPESLRRLQLVAQGSGTLFFALRPAHAARIPSPAPLRIALAPAANGLTLTLLKRRGPVCDRPLYIPLEPATTPVPIAVPSTHAPVDRPVTAPAAAGRPASPVAA
jgi:protein ImuA